MRLITTAHFVYYGWTVRRQDNVKTKNCVYWLNTNPHTVALVPSFDVKITVCCLLRHYKLSCSRTVFLWGSNTTGCVTCSVTASRYIAKLQNSSNTRDYNTRVASTKCTKLFGCKMLLIHIKRSLFAGSWNSILVIASSHPMFFFYGFCDPPDLNPKDF